MTVCARVYVRDCVQGGAGLTRPWGDSGQGFPCCWGTSSEAFAGRHIENIFHEAAGHSGVYVHLFEPATLSWPARGAVIQQESGFPASTTFTSRLTILAPAAVGGAVFSLLVRVPAWATGANTATLNGLPLAGVTPGTYLNVTRAWALGDELAVYFPAAVRWEALTDDRPQWAGVGALVFGDLLLAGANVTTDVLGGTDPANVSQWVTRVPGDGPLAFSVAYNDVCSSGPATLIAVPIADITFETYTVYWHTGPAGIPSVGYNSSGSSVLSGAAGEWATLGGAAVLANGPTDNIRSGDPDQINSAFLTTAVRDPTHAVKGVAFSYQYVSGYGPAGRHVGANFTVLLVDACAAPGVAPPPPAAVRAVVYQSPELTMYPYDVDPTGYSPLQPVSVTFPTPVPVTNATRILLVFYDNDRNIQLNLPMDMEVFWA